ncbi:MAG: PAS domain-containing protein [bacterium]
MSDNKLEKIQNLLNASEKNFRNLLNSIGDLIVVARPDGQILFTNKAFNEKLSYTPQSLKKIHVLDLNPKENRKEAEKIFADMFAGKRDSCPLPIVAKDGTMMPAETRVWFGEWDGAHCIYGIIKDLTADQEEKQKFERLFQNNPSPMAISTLPSHNFSDVNEAFLKVLGYTKDEVVGTTSEALKLFIHPEEQRVLAKKLQATGRIDGHELQVRRKDGEIIDGLFYGEVISSQGKKFFLTVMIDVTTLKRAKSELISNETKFQSFVENASDIIYTLSPKGVVTYISPNWTRIFGHKIADLVGQSLENFIHPQDIEQFQGYVTKVLTKGNKLDEIEYRLRHKDGTWRWQSATSSVIRDNNGKIMSFLGISRDISERKKAMEELERMNQFMTGRELKMAELKKEIEALKKKLPK